LIRSADHLVQVLRKPVDCERLSHRSQTGFIGVTTEEHTTPMFRSTVAIRLFAPVLSSLLVMSFSNASTTPSLHLMPIAVPPFSTALAAYSTLHLSVRYSGVPSGRSRMPGSFYRLVRRPSSTSHSLCLSKSVMAKPVSGVVSREETLKLSWSYFRTQSPAYIP